MPTRDSTSLLAFGAHPDDIEFGCGGIVARETSSGHRAHLVVCSRGEAGSHGTPAQRTRETKHAAAILGATVEFLELDGDAHLEVRAVHAIALARTIRRHRPDIVLAPSLAGNQHPDHARLGQLVRDACRLARFGGLRELKKLKPHAIGHLLYYAVTPEAEPADLAKVLVDISPPKVFAAWVASMRAHASQGLTRNYVDFQVVRAHLNGMRAGVAHAQAVFPNDPLLFDSLGRLGGSARRF